MVNVSLMGTANRGHLPGGNRRFLVQGLPAAPGLGIRAQRDQCAFVVEPRSRFIQWVDGTAMTPRAYFTIVGVTVKVQPLSSESADLMMNALPLCWYPACPLGMASIMPLGAGTAILCLTD